MRDTYYFTGDVFIYMTAYMYSWKVLHVNTELLQNYYRIKLKSYNYRLTLYP